jgi:hypothetical protein
LLKLLLPEPRLIPTYQNHLKPDWISHPGVRRILEACLQATRNGAVDPAQIVGNLQHPHDRSLASEALAENRPIPNRDQQVNDLLRRLRDQEIDRELARLSSTFADERFSNDDRAQMLLQQQELRRQKKEPLVSPEAY